jgi:glycosyltransferase involved in cell wall biosynthesis
MTRVIFWLPAINPYWRDRFNALHRDGRVEFACWFNDHLDPARSWQVPLDTLRFPHEFLPNESTPARLRRAVALYREQRPRKIFTFHFDPHLWPVWLHRLRGGHVTLYALMTWDSWVKRTRAKEIAKRVFFTSASSVLTPGPDSDAYVRRYGARNVGRLHHAVDQAALAAAGSGRQVAPELRLLYVGRLVEAKGLRFLMRVLEGMLPELQKWSRQFGGRVSVSGFVQAEELPGVYAASDVLLFPTKGDPYGLVVDEAMAAGMPVVSSDRAGDISWRLADGRGWFFREGDEEGWVSLLTRLASDRQLVVASGAAASSFSEGHDLDRWVDELVAWARR